MDAALYGPVLQAFDKVMCWKAIDWKDALDARKVLDGTSKLARQIVHLPVGKHFTSQIDDRQLELDKHLQAESKLDSAHSFADTCSKNANLLRPQIAEGTLLKLKMEMAALKVIAPPDFFKTESFSMKVGMITDVMDRAWAAVTRPHFEKLCGVTSWAFGQLLKFDQKDPTKIPGSEADLKIVPTMLLTVLSS